MIVRVSIECTTCEQPHTLRIGLGQENSQTHQFNCRSCAEQIIIKLNLDHENAGVGIEPVKNCALRDEITGAPIVNLEADFLVPRSEQGKDFSFSRMMQLDEIFKKQKRDRGNIGTPNSFIKNFNEIKRPDYAEEFKDLKKAWSLARNGHGKLVARKISEANVNRYKAEPLDDLPDWIFRFASILTQPAYEPVFLNAMQAVTLACDKNESFEMLDYFSNNSKLRGDLYFDIIRDFFLSFSEFSQVYLLVSQGMVIHADLQASSTGFDAVRAFYGDCYEKFVSLTDYLAFTNNILAGRKFDEFAQLKLSDYKKLDKANRFGPFKSNTALLGICAEANPSIRNASHHGSFRFDSVGQIITYRSGKGAQEKSSLSLM